ncbi:hypothetical protein [uncultured Sulfitobacter sp.]|uniref:hypothetical protein n=1 Tax=uncultured Sulfitobacter sp. TaxID=191468 RepID=UPI002633BA4B|nr:hypothetical protein [uncultured Sulfitobacter sp.]
MGNMGELHSRLHGGLWHTTRPDRLLSIVEAQAILVEPDIHDRDRSNTANGPKNYPISRTIGGISLFDFNGLHPESYEKQFPVSSWHFFVPYVRSWQGSVWLEIERDVVREQLVSSEALLQKWKKEGFHGHNILPGLEAAHVGDLPISAIRSAFLTWDDGREIREFNIRDFDHEFFNQMLREWQEAIGK